MRHMFRSLTRIFVLLCSLFLAILPGQADPLPAEVQLALRDAGIPPEHVGVVAWPADQKRPLLAWQARQPMSPASTMKLLTSVVALDMLGPAHVWQTDILADQTPQNGRLTGNLYLRGHGDPGLTDERLFLLVRQLRESGLREIDGDLVIDESAFDLPHSPPFDDQPWRAYNARPAATMLNFDSTRVTLGRLPSGAIDVQANWLPPGSRIINQLTSNQDNCGDWREAIRTSWDQQQQMLTIAGNWPASCSAPAEFFLTEQQPAALLASAFSSLWLQSGGRIGSSWREGDTPANAILLQEFPSQPLGELLTGMNKYSNNIMAKTLWLDLANQQPATSESAGRTVEQWLQQKHLNLPSLVTDNGSGLSRTSSISPLDMAQLLVFASQQAWWPELAASLPVTGVDGTMKKRTLDDKVAGHAHIKTGSLDGVKTMAGYVTLSNGRVVTVVFDINDPHASAGKAAQDALLEWIYRHDWHPLPGECEHE